MNPEEPQKYELVSHYPAKSEDFACNRCGADIRDIRCCDLNHCDKYEVSK